MHNVVRQWPLIPTRNIAGVREGIGQTSTAAAQVLNAAQELARQSNSLLQEVGTFCPV
jgi:methyl-accepting chemotaxis protein